MTRYLDSLARWILTNCDYPVLGLFIVFILIGFSFWRRFRYKLWPTREDYYRLGMSLIGTIGGFTATLVFLFTKPPAVNLLSGPTLLFLGLIVPIVVIGAAYSQLEALFFPPEAPKLAESSFEKKPERELFSDFVLEAIGMEECLSTDTHEPGTVSLDTVDVRIRLLQESEPGRANKCGVPGVADMMRKEKIRDILRELVSAGKIQRCRQADRWKVLSGDSGRQLRA